MKGVTFLDLDVTSDESVTAAVGEVIDRFGRIDVLVNNAGIGSAGAAEESSAAQAQGLFDINVFGVIRMTNAVLPHMRAQRSGRIINISSIVGFMPQPYMAVYAASKHAVEGYSESVDHEVREYGVRVLLVEPAWTNTAFDAASVRPDQPLDVYAKQRHVFEEYMAEAVKDGDDPAVVAKEIVARGDRRQAEAALHRRRHDRTRPHHAPHRPLPHVRPAAAQAQPPARLSTPRRHPRARDRKAKLAMSTYLADAAEDLTVEGPSATFTYRRIGPRGGVPLVLLNRVRGTLDWWDPEFLDHLAADHDVIVFDNVGTGYTTGTPRDSVEGLADGTVEFIEALGLHAGRPARLDPGRHRRPAHRPHAARPGPQAGRGGRQPGRHGARSARPEPEGAGHHDQARGHRGRPGVPVLPRDGHRTRRRVRNTSPGSPHGWPPDAPTCPRRRPWARSPRSRKDASIPFEQVRADLATIRQPVLYATGMQDAMIPALASYTAVQHLTDATLVAYSDAGHAFLFQHAKDFATQVSAFLAD